MMNTSTSTMFGGNGNQITVLERQQARIQSQQQQQSYFNEAHFNLLTLPPLSLPSTAEQLHGLITNESLVKVVVDPGMENGWSEFGKYPILKPGFGVETTGFGSVSNESVKNSAEMMDYSISRTTSCPPAVAESRVEIGVVRQGLNMKKRKADKAQSPKASVAEEAREKKRSKGSSDDESKVTEQSNINNNNNSSNITTITTTNNNNNNNNKENSGDSSKENSKVFEPQKSDYIHVRARRGQATDSHSLAERVRREKISERMKYLQDLVPGCNKITGKAGMLDEIINYVQSLQRQVEFLSMKLATVNPRQDFNIDNFFPKEMYTACSGGFSSIGMSSEMENCSAYLPYNPVQQVVSCCGMDMVINPPDALRRTTSAPVSAPDALLDTSCFTQTNPTSSPWETDLQSLYNLEFNQARSTLFPPQSFTETMEANHLKMEL